MTVPRQQLVEMLAREMRRLERSHHRDRPGSRSPGAQTIGAQTARSQADGAQSAGSEAERMLSVSVPLDASQTGDASRPGGEHAGGSQLQAEKPAEVRVRADQVCEGLVSNPSFPVSGLRTSGLRVLDELLVERGLPPGSLVEWMEPGPGSGVDTLALWSAARARRPSELLIVIDSRGDFYPPAGVALGLDLRTTVVIRPRTSEEALWTLEQTLRTPGVGVVVCPWSRLTAQAFRRLQLAAETGGGLGMLLRPARQRGEASFAEVRWGVQPLPSAESGRRRWRVELLRARRQLTKGSVELELHDDGNRLHLVPAMVAAAHFSDAAGA